MNNITALRTELSNIFTGLKEGTITHETAKEMNNAAGKIIKSCAVQLEYQLKAKDKPNIAFLEGE